MKAITESPSMGWISDDLDNAINAAKLSFESFLSGGATQEVWAQLEAAHSNTLACVKIFESAGLVTAEQMAIAISNILQRLIDKNIDEEQDAFQVVIGGYNQLNNYLCRLKSKGEEPAVHVLPVLNDLLSVAGESLYLPEEQFVLAEKPVADDSAMAFLAGEDAKRASQAVVELLNSLSSSQENQQDVFQTCYDALQAIDADNEVLQVICDIAAAGVESKKLGISARYALVRAVNLLNDGGEQADCERVFSECLYCLCLSHTESASALVAKYGLDRALQTESVDGLLHLGTPDGETIAIVLDGLLGDIEKVQLALKDCAEAEGAFDENHTVVSIVSNIQYTLKMIQFNTVAHKLSSVIDKLAEAEQTSHIDAAALENVVASLFEIEQLLIARKSGSGRDASELSVLEQLRITVADLASSLNSFVSDTDAAKLQESQVETRQQIALVNGACRFTTIDGLSDVASALGARYVVLVDESVAQGATPELIDSAKQLAELYGQFETYLAAVAESNHSLVAQQLTSIADVLGIVLNENPDVLQDAIAPAKEHVADANASAEAESAVSASIEECDESSDTVEELSVNSGTYVEQALACELDDDIVEIFLEEAEEVFEAINENLAALQEEPDNSSALADLRRGYHTLKGSGRMAGAEDVGNAAWSIENMLNRVIEGGGSCSAARFQMVGEANQYMAILIDYFARRIVPYTQALESFIQRADMLADDENAVVAHDESLLLEQAKNEPAAAEEMVAPEHTEPALEEAPAAASDEASLVDSEEPLVEEELLAEETSAPEVSVEDTAENVVDINTAINEPVVEEVSADDLISAVSMANTDGNVEEQLANVRGIFINELNVQVAVLESFCNASEEDDAIVPPDDKLERCIHTLVGGARIAELNEWADVLAPAEKLIADCRRKQSMNSQQFDAVRHLLNELVPLSEGVFEPGDSAIQLSETFEQLLADNSNTESATPSIEAVAESVVELSDHCQWVFDWSSLLRQWRVSGSVPSEAADMTSELAQVADDSYAEPKIVELCQKLCAVYEVCDGSGLHRDAYEVLCKAHDELVSALDSLAIGEPVVETIGLLESFISSEIEAESQHQAAIKVRTGSEQSAASELDREIVDIFLEESADLIEELETTIATWLEDQETLEHLEALLRPLHTLKGGARMAGLESIGNCCHEFETEIQGVKLGDTKVTAKFVKLVQGRLEELNTEFERITNEDNVVAAEEQKGESEASEKRVAEMVRVPSDLLDNLVNLAGETSISRSLVEERLADFSHSIDEVEETVDRLKEQLRRLEIETEAQIAFRREKVEIEGLEEFDPLEMDRYSQFQQLSKSLVESASDLKDLKSTLREKTRDVETLLLQQSRINTELQEGLMRTRTVPLSRTIVPRLRKTVRQVSGELDKPITFNVGNSDGELDKSVIERMVAPLEHVLRNAIDHGIESVAAREKAGKPAAGAIRMTIDREGSDVVVKISDDGKGIDTKAVRKKAIEKGVISKSQKLSEEELQQLIFAQGFSTAESVTQISGRGVGMDVVRSELAELGGTVELQSTKGQGTTFIFRLPFTMSMNRALLVSAGGESIAVPLDTIEGIVRLSPYELNEYYGEDAVDFMYAGQTYDFHYLGTALNGSKPQYSTDMIGALPVLLVRNKQRLLAYQVDRLLGSREIVVKSLGPQFTGLEGINGATVLGDGSVVMIADLGALALQIEDAAQQGKDDKVNDTVSAGPRDRALVMVVDDSVTVRKVTTRLLEREGFEVVTAKDGQDAMDQLEDVKPDVMLLDIEMPRLDGFEVVSRVRHDNRLSDLPIIMISSRTGEKHRERAISLGANDFLGKPYQDQVLMQTIAQVAPGVAAFLSVAP